MNFGIYGFPSTYGLATSSIISITEFDASGTYVIPPNASVLQILLIGGGGGGGGGAQSGANTTGFPYGGGGGGGGGSIVYSEFLVSELGVGTRLNIQIGQGGPGGARGSGSTTTTVNLGAANGLGTVGSASIITIPGRPGFFIRALGGGAAVGSAAGGNGGIATAGGTRTSSFNGVPMTNLPGANGSWNTSIANGQVADAGWTGTYVYIQDQRSNGGAAGGSVISQTSAAFGGSIEIINLNGTTVPLQVPVIYDMIFSVLGASGQGITAVYGGLTGNVVGGSDSRANGGNGIMIFSSMKHIGGGAGGGGGGASVVGNAGNGGNGYRGGGGGGGGACRGIGFSGGTGGNGGNGYCCIVARG